MLNKAGDALCDICEKEVAWHTDTQGNALCPACFYDRGGTSEVAPDTGEFVFHAAPTGQLGKRPTFPPPNSLAKRKPKKKSRGEVA